jgi:hypothetical protein
MHHFNPRLSSSPSLSWQEFPTGDWTLAEGLPQYPATPLSEQPFAQKLGTEGLELISMMLKLNPDARISAQDAMDSSYFALAEKAETETEAG